ncbi:MAG: AsmA family protein [Terracidiphilus sp.]
MTDDAQPRQRKHQRLWLALAALAALLAVLIVPPLVSVSRYKSRITRLISASLGRPARLSSVEVRLLPRPGFLLTDLTVEEDPAYGAEPVLHANTVAASIRLLSLWRGRLEIDTISVDEASLNLVRTPVGRWNLDPLLRTATAQAQSEEGGDAPDNRNKPVRLPYLEATNSRINIKNGDEKLPYSLLNAEMSLSQQSPGDWRVRLRGQPVRTDLSMEQADTGIVRLEANLHQAPELRQMPVHLDLEWREAQLGQLTRLLLGSDAGWRGDLTGELHLDGTADAAQIKAQLRATGVHRAEFAPEAPLDFDANCGLVAHFSTRAIDNLVCDSPLGDGHLRLAGNLPGDGGLPRLSVELDRIPVAAALDALRTVRSDFAPGLDAAGSASGKLTYDPAVLNSAPPEKLARAGRVRPAKTHPAEPGPLSGSLAVEGLELSGNGLSQPIRFPKFVLEPVPAPAIQMPGLSEALAATVAFPAGGPGPLTVSTRLALSGYQVTVRGQASILRARELAYLAGIANASALDALAGDPISVDLAAGGPWFPIQAPIEPPVQTPPKTQAPPSALLPSATGSALPAGDTIAGTVTLRNVNWKADYLANHVEISQATLHLAAGEFRWDPVVFSYGPVKGTASITLPVACSTTLPCPPTFQLQFGALDAGLLQAAFLGARERGTMLSTLIDRFRPSVAPAWPRFEGTVKAESLILGPVTLHAPGFTLVTLPNGAEISAFDAALLGGRVHGTGTLHSAASAQDKPSYALTAQFDKLSPSAVAQLLGLHSTGGVFDGNGKIELAGFTADDLAASAKGALHFAWQHGGIAATSVEVQVPPALARFDRWTADAEIANSALTLKDNQVKRGAHSVPVQVAVTFADPPKVIFGAPTPAPAASKPASPTR